MSLKSYCGSQNEHCYCFQVEIIVDKLQVAHHAQINWLRKHVIKCTESNMFAAF